MGNFSENNSNNFDNSKVIPGSIKYSDKLGPAESGKYALFNAVDIDWQGYKIGDIEMTYTGDILSYIESSYEYVRTHGGGGSGGSIWDGDTVTSRNQINLYTLTENTTAPEKPFVNAANVGNVSYFN